MEGIAGKYGQLPPRAANALIRRASADGSLTENPPGVLTSLTVFDESLKAFGRRTAWELPDLKTFAMAVVIRIYRIYESRFVKPYKLVDPIRVHGPPMRRGGGSSLVRVCPGFAPICAAASPAKLTQSPPSIESLSAP